MTWPLPHISVLARTGTIYAKPFGWKIHSSLNWAAILAKYKRDQKTVSWQIDL